MLTSSRLTWFFISFLFVLPSMLVMFRGAEGITREVVGRSIPFAVLIAAMTAAVFGKGQQ